MLCSFLEQAGLSRPSLQEDPGRPVIWTSLIPFSGSKQTHAHIAFRAEAPEARKSNPCLLKSRNVGAAGFQPGVGEESSPILASPEMQQPTCQFGRHGTKQTQLCVMNWPWQIAEMGWRANTNDPSQGTAGRGLNLPLGRSHSWLLYGIWEVLSIKPPAHRLKSAIKFGLYLCILQGQTWF